MNSRPTLTVILAACVLPALARAGGRGVCGDLDVTPPVITCPPDITLHAQAPISPEYTGTATAVDACDGVLSEEQISHAYANSPPCPLPRVRRWTARDAAGNSASCTQTITRVHPHDCCQMQTEMFPGCSDPSIEACVCAMNSFCCEVKWDAACVELVAQCGYACTQCSDPCNEYVRAHDCCWAHGAGCSDEAITEAVCALSSYCCTDRWDDTCVAIADWLGRCPDVDCPVLGLHPNGIPDACEANCDDDIRVDTCEFHPPSCPTGACCIGIVCEEVGEEACGLRHGAYGGDGSLCTAETCADCNHNVLVDGAEIAAGLVRDCNANGRPDGCEPEADVNGDGIPDACGACCRTSGRCVEALAGGCMDGDYYGAGTTCVDTPCGTPRGACCVFGTEACADTSPTFCGGAEGAYQGHGTLCAEAACRDCDGNGVRDAAEIAEGVAADCDGNLVPDPCDVVAVARDCNHNLVPDDCEVMSSDCDGNGVADVCDLMIDATDCDENHMLDRCEMAGGDGDGNGVLDVCESGACCRSGGCAREVPSACTKFVCDVAALLPSTFGGCYGDADGNGTVNPGDRGFVAANIGASEDVAICLYDVDGNGFVNAGDRGYVAANLELCEALPDWQNGSGLNRGQTDPRFAAPAFLGSGTSCGEASCP